MIKSKKIGKVLKYIKKRICKLCNRRYDHQYKLFGRGCLNSEYKLLHIPRQNKVDDKEMYLCNCVALQLHKFGLTKNQKYFLAEKYLTMKYLDRIKYGNLKIQKENLYQEIQNISLTKIPVNSTSSISLNDAYKAYNLTKKFEKEISKLSKMKSDFIEYTALEGVKFIFNTLKINDPFLYSIYYQMQYVFWQIIIAGGYFKKYELSAKLLTNSLSLADEISSDMTLTDEYELEKIVNSDAFKDKIKYLINKYGKSKISVNINEQTVTEKKDSRIEFNDDIDLFMSIHGGTINVNGIRKGKNKWDLDVQILDIYDFTDWKDKDDIYNDDSSIKRKFGNILNNFGVVSMKYGVLKSFKIIANIKLIEYSV